LSLHLRLEDELLEPRQPEGFLEVVGIRKDIQSMLVIPTERERQKRDTQRSAD
jgi:hypothetical protein